MHIRSMILLLALSLIAAGCSLVAGDPEDVASTTPAAVAAPSTEPAPTATPSPSPSADPEPTEEEPELDENGVAPGGYPLFGRAFALGTAATCQYAGEEWCEDSNDNVWPDFVEEAIGRDPLVDGCLVGDCGGPDLASFDLAQLQENTLFILDASGSMAGDAGGGQTKMEAAKAALVEYVTVTPGYADLGLVVYGHQGDNSDAGRPVSCAGIDAFAAMGDLTFENVEGVVGQFQPTGWTPIAAALDASVPVLQAAADADAAEGLDGVTNRIILISDGIETCDGDPVASAQALTALGFEVVVDVIGFDIGDGDRAALQQVAEVTGGVYSDAADGAALRAVLGQYNAQRVAVSESLACQVNAMSQAGNCSTSLSQAASDHVLAIADDAGEDGDRELRSFLIDWASAARQDSLNRMVENLDRMRLVVEELRVLYDEAIARREAFDQGRNQKPIGRPISFDCPFGVHPASVSGVT